MNENMKRNHKDIEWKQLFFEIPVFFTHPVDTGSFKIIDVFKFGLRASKIQ